MENKYKNYLKLINFYEKKLLYLDKVFLKETKNKFHAFFLMNLLVWYKKDSVDSFFSNFINRKSVETNKIKDFFLKLYLFFKFLLFFFLILTFKFLSFLKIKKSKNFFFLINFPRANDTFFEKNVDLYKTIKKGIFFDFLYNLKDIFSNKKNFIFHVTFISINEIIYNFFEAINIFFAFKKAKKKIAINQNYQFDFNEYNIFNIYLKLIQICILKNEIKKIK